MRQCQRINAVNAAEIDAVMPWFAQGLVEGRGERHRGAADGGDLHGLADGPRLGVRSGHGGLDRAAWRSAARVPDAAEPDIRRFPAGRPFAWRNPRRCRSLFQSQSDRLRGLEGMREKRLSRAL